MSFGMPIIMGENPQAARTGREPIGGSQIGKGQVGGGNIGDNVNQTVPTKTTGLSAIAAFKAFTVAWNIGPESFLDYYQLQYSESADNQATWGDWQSIPSILRSTVYPHTTLDPAKDYRYQVRSRSKAGVWSLWSDICVAGKPGKASMSEDIIGGSTLLSDVALHGTQIQENAESIALIAARKSGIGNAIFDSSFELHDTNDVPKMHLSGGWGGMTVTHSFDTSTFVHGSVSLKSEVVGSGSVGFFYTEPMRVRPGNKYIYSMFAKASQGLQTSLENFFYVEEKDENNVTLRGRGLGGAQLTTEWQRFSVEYEPSPDCAIVSLQCFDYNDGPLTYWFDALQFEQGDVMSPYNCPDTAQRDIAALVVEAGEISSTVASLSGTVSQHSTTIQQNSGAIDLRVVKGTVVAEINASTEGVRIAGDKIVLDGNTQVDGDFTVSGDVVVEGTLRTEALEANAVTRHGSVHASDVVNVSGATWTDIPDMSVQVTASVPATLFAIFSARVVGSDQDRFLSTRLVVGPDTGESAEFWVRNTVSMHHTTSVEAGTYTVKAQWLEGLPTAGLGYRELTVVAFQR